MSISRLLVAWGVLVTRLRLLLRHLNIAWRHLVGDLLLRVLHGLGLDLGVILRNLLLHRILLVLHLRLSVHLLLRVASIRLLLVARLANYNSNSTTRLSLLRILLIHLLLWVLLMHLLLLWVLLIHLL